MRNSNTSKYFVFLEFAGCTHDKYIGSNNYINVWVYKLKVNIILYIFFYKSSDFLLSIRLEISLVGFFTIFPLFIERFCHALIQFE